MFAIGDQTPEGIGAVEILLHQGVGAAPALAPAVQGLVIADDVNGRGLRVLGSPVREVEGFGLDHRGPALEYRLIVQALQEGMTQASRVKVVALSRERSLRRWKASQ